MAEMYKEITKKGKWDFNPSENDEDWIGQRTFLRDDIGGTFTLAQLPVPGVSNVTFTATPFYRSGFQPTSFIARGVKFRLDCGSLTKAYHYIVKYAAKSVSDRDFPSTQDPTLSLRKGSELLILKNVNNNAGVYQFEDGNGQLANKVDGGVKVFMPVADYVVTDPGFATFGAATAAMSPSGRVLNTDSRWLSVGADIDEYRDDDDTELFRLVKSYKYRSIPGPAFGNNLNSADGWQLVWNPIKVQWWLTNPLTYPVSAFVDVMPSLP